jgi:hypothetical protein
MVHCGCAAVLQVVNYESLLRRVIPRAPNAAIMSVALFPFFLETVRVPGNATATTQVPYPFHNSGELNTGIMQVAQAVTASLAAASMMAGWHPHWCTAACCAHPICVTVCSLCTACAWMQARSCTG